MSNKSRGRRGPTVPPRPQVIPEQLRQQIGPSIPRVLNREQCIEFAVMLAANLDRMLNNRTQLPWITSTIDKRSDGFSLHVQVVEPSADSDTDTDLVI